jgi:hypothetical protein
VGQPDGDVDVEAGGGQGVEAHLGQRFGYEHTGSHGVKP